MKYTLKSLIFTLLIVACGLNAKAEGEIVNVDLNQIEVDMAMNPAKYNQLLDRFVKADTTLTHAEVAYLYLGQGFSPQYDPYQAYPMLMNAYDSQDYATAASLAEAVVDESPMSLDLLITALVAATRSGNVDMALQLQPRLNLLVDCIVETGKGTNAAEPFYVASTADLRQFLRNILGINDVVETTTVGNGDVEAWKVRLPDSEREHILYFNNSLEHRFDATRRK